MANPTPIRGPGSGCDPDVELGVRAQSGVMPFHANQGDPLQPSRNIAARAGRWSAAHRKTAVLGWILFVVVATLIGGKIGQTNLKSSEMGNGESKQGMGIIDAANFPDSIGADDPQVTAAMKDVVNRLQQIKGVDDIESPLNREQRANTVSKDGRSVVVNFTLAGKDETKDDLASLEKVADAPLAAVAAVQKSHPE